MLIGLTAQTNPGAADAAGCILCQYLRIVRFVKILPTSRVPLRTLISPVNRIRAGRSRRFLPFAPCGV